ncbi:hypothetical protein DYBT9275_02279 [Dyadobacter sp. CECT 9275]|uniref:Methyltransferase type 11 domain-containing protein n=1 Tax=Dyadobacter helix TaxID=2822344 RepID=A0A916JFC6_9BACT|nr:methyltransferase domain-containing protein [Dyadobacter sp. CECT 9275]CAG4999684.1 hypothetical protein DYBT9275_02279 [Dyadobacter sp. CECT 9275]
MSNKKPALLNVGCGDKFHGDWTNIDMVSHYPEVIEYNILNELPFQANTYDVVYHSQVLEHIPRERSIYFLSECYRVTKPGGIIRIVTPDLENIVKEYLTYLNLCLSDKNDLAEQNYDWILLEMYDQTVRNYNGGQMLNYIERPVLINEEYVIGRIGYVAELIRSRYLNATKGKERDSFFLTLLRRISRNFNYSGVRRNLLRLLLTREEMDFMRIGQFRKGGEVHYWMYDRFSLSRMLTEVGFNEVKIKTPFESDILDWARYELDVKNNRIYDPTSLFIEARKPVSK